MKKVVIIVFLFASLLVFSACNKTTTSGTTTSTPNLDGTLESILTQIYTSEKLDEQFREFASEGLVTTEVTNDNMEYYLGKSGLVFKKAIASESTFSTSAYSLVLVRANSLGDVNQLKAEIKNNVDPNKWICVGVDPSNVLVENIGDVIILIMSNSNAQELREAFLELKQ